MINSVFFIADVLFGFNSISSLRSKLDTGNAIVICGDKVGALMCACSPYFIKLDKKENGYGFFIGRFNGSIEVYINYNLPSNKLIMTYKGSNIKKEQDLNLQDYNVWQE